jgi:hypothetical protein
MNLLFICQEMLKHLHQKRRNWKSKHRTNAENKESSLRLRFKIFILKYLSLKTLFPFNAMMTIACPDDEIADFFI